MRKKIVLGLVTLLPFLIEAQSFYAIRRPRNLAVSGGSGTAAYLGELTNPGSLGKVRYNFVVGAEYLFSRRFSAKGELVWFNIAGSDVNADDDRVERNLSFSSNNQELSLSGLVNLMPNPKEFFRRSMFNAYAFAGVGLLHMNPKAEFEGQKYALQPLQTEGISYNKFQFAIPYGIGVKIMVSPLNNIVIEAGNRKLFTDYLDDISSKRYTDPSTLIGGATGISAKLSDRRKERDPNYPLDYTRGVRGNPQSNDSYFLLNIKVEYYFPTLFGANSGNKSFYKKKRKGVFNPGRR